MPRSVLAYLADVVDACEAVESHVAGVDLDAYRSTRSLRSAVEREFIVIGGAVNNLTRLEPQLGHRISRGRRIVDFLDQLTYDYYATNDAAVWAVATEELAPLRHECSALLAEREAGLAGA